MVPSEPIVRVVEDQGSVEDAMMNHPRVWHRMTQEMQPFMEFDTVDRMLCAMGHQGQWVRGELHDIYYGVNLSRMPRLYVNTRTGERACAAVGCSNRFTRRTSGRGGHGNQMYCSTSCRQRASRIRRGKMQEGHKGRYHSPFEGREFVCRNGHERTPETTEVLKSGTRRCKLCNRERTQEWRARRRRELVTA